MASESERIRRLMDLLEGSGKPVMLNEGWLQNLKDKKLSKLGNKERAQMAKRLKDEWLKWLGQTGRPGTMEDMERFMAARIGFNDTDIQTVMSQAIPDAPVAQDKPVQDKKVAKGSEQAPAEPEEDGRPIPDDLDTKMSDYGDVGKKDKWADAKVHTVDEKSIMTNGRHDEAKIRKAMEKLKPGEVLKYGQQRRMKGGSSNESIMEAEADVLEPEVIDAIFDRSAARVNDEYLLNGPRNDQADIEADAAAAGLNRQSGRGRGGYANDRGKMASGSYDAKEMVHALETQLDVKRPAIESMTQHVVNAEKSGQGFARMQKTDLDVLARIGYAFLKART